MLTLPRSERKGGNRPLAGTGVFPVSHLIPYLSSPAIVRPAAERTVTRRVTINGKRQTIHLCAYGWETRNSWGHSAYCPELGIAERVRYYNRTWEASRFDTVLSLLFDKCRMTDAAYCTRKGREKKAKKAWYTALDAWRKANPEKDCKAVPASLQWDGFWKTWSRKHPARKPRKADNADPLRFPAGWENA